MKTQQQIIPPAPVGLVALHHLGEEALPGALEAGRGRRGAAGTGPAMHHKRLAQGWWFVATEMIGD